MNKLTISQKIFIILFFTILVPPLLLIKIVNIFEQKEISSIESSAEELQKKLSYKLDNFNITSMEENNLSDFLEEIVKSEKKISKISVLSQYENKPYCNCLATSQKDYFYGAESYKIKYLNEALSDKKLYSEFLKIYEFDFPRSQYPLTLDDFLYSEYPSKLDDFYLNRSYYGPDYYYGRKKYDGEEVIDALEENKISVKERYYFNNTEALSALYIAIPYNHNSGKKFVILYKGNYYSKAHVLVLLESYLRYSFYFVLILFFIIFFVVIYPFSRLNKYLMTDVYKQRKILKKNLVVKEMPYFRNDFFGEMARNIDEYSTFLNTMASGLCLNTELKIVDAQKSLESIKNDITVFQETGNKEVLSDIISQVNIITRNLSIPFNLIALQEKFYNTTVGEARKFNISYEAYREFNVNTDYSINYNNNQIIEIIKNIISTYEMSNIGFSYDSSNYSIVIQENHLEQIFRILLDNAIEAGNEVYVTLKKIDSVLHINVEDNGEGLENSLYIFEPFYTSWPKSREKHIGLGLTLLREIVRGYKGEIVTNYDKPINGKYSGACFEITLPLF